MQALLIIEQLFLHDTRGRCVPELVCMQLCAGMTNYRTTFLHETRGICVPELVCMQLCAGITNYRTTFLHDTRGRCVPELVCRQLCAGITNYITTVLRDTFAGGLRVFGATGGLRLLFSMQVSNKSVLC